MVRPPRALACAVLAMPVLAACPAQDLDPIADGGWDAGLEPPAWQCAEQRSIVGADELPTWVVPDRFEASLSRWEMDGRALDATIRTENDSGPEFFGPCAAADGDLVGLALTLGPLHDGEAESHLFVGMNDGPRTYDVATETGDDAPAIELHCSQSVGGYWSSAPTSGTVEVVTLPVPGTSPLRIVAHTEGECAIDLEIDVVFPIAAFD